MEFADAVAARRMVRRFDPSVPVPAAVLDRLLDAARRAPSAGFTQAVSYLVLTRPEDRQRYWALTVDRVTRWAEGLGTAPALVLVWTSETAYLDRYAEPDKGWADRDPQRWSAPYWWVDAGMGAQTLLLGAVDAGLGACFVGVPPDRQHAVAEAFGVPAGYASVGLVALGTPAGPGAPGGSPSRRKRRAADEVVHRHRWGS